MLTAQQAKELSEKFDDELHTEKMLELIVYKNIENRAIAGYNNCHLEDYDSYLRNPNFAINKLSELGYKVITSVEGKKRTLDIYW